MATIEACQTWNQPTHSEGRRDADGKHRTWPRRGRFFDELRNRVERLGQSGLESPTLIGELQPVGATPKQREAEALLQQLHLLADGGLRHVQFRRGGSEAAAAARSFECTKRVQKRQMSHHPKYP